MPDKSISNTDRLFESIAAGNVSAVRELLTKDSSVAEARDEQGVSAIVFSLYHQQTDIADVLRSSRGDLDAFEAAALGEFGCLRDLLRDNPALKSAYSPDGFTLLALACYLGRETAARLLIDAGADVNAESSNGAKLRCLHGAVAGRHTGVLRLLLEAGADPNVRQAGGWTPLHGAANHGDEEQVRLLLARGADRSIQSDEGKTARDMADAKEFDAVVMLLDKA